jgi:AraC-like DNA-binding protein
MGTRELQNNYYQILLEAVRKEPYYEQRLPNLLSAWPYQMLSQRQRGSRNPQKEEEQRPTVRVKKYINENFTQELPLDKLAEISGYSKSYLCQIFREDTGMTINSYINDVRISSAVKLLADTELSVSEVGERCGYNSVFYFIKAFKKRMGVPPGSYRKSELTGVDKVEGHVDSVNSAMRASDVLMLRINQAES